MSHDARLADLDADDSLRDPARKRRYVSAVFETVAPSYDRFTRWFSFGMDARWKRRLARWALDGLPPGETVLDLACGTGDVERAVRRMSGQAVSVVGLDLSPEMLARARRRAGGGVPDRPSGRAPVRLVRADMLAIPLREGAAGAVTAAYGFRNAPDVALTLADVARVLRDGGRLVSLDFFRPEHRAWDRVFRGYLRGAGRAVGRWWHGEPDAYGYIDRSLEAWCTPDRFGDQLRIAGFTVEAVTQFLGGGVCLHAARRNPRSGRA